MLPQHHNLKAYGISSEFEWLDALEYSVVLKEIASTDVVRIEWAKLRDIIKYRISQNVSLYLSESLQATAAPITFAPHSLESGGMKLPPFPPRGRVESSLSDPPIVFMTPQQADEMKGVVFAQLHEFENDPPFTIQRVCELCIRPKEHYKAIGKYLRAVEKSLLVTSTCNAFLPLSAKEQEPYTGSKITLGNTSQSAPATPLFSPIPFLHDDARRSKSRSPPPSPLALSAAGPISGGHPETLETKALGLVDELDDPNPGHMSDHPIALTSTTTVEPRPFLGSLEQRFAPSVAGGDGPDAVLDDADDKENKA